MLLVHATTVEINGQGVLIRGPSGSGKSDLAIRLIDGGAILVADDQTEVSAQGDRVVAHAPDPIAGLLEVRGLGLVSLPHRPWVPLALVIDLIDSDKVERLPEPSQAYFLGLAVPRMDLAPFQASAAAKVRLAILSAKRDIMRS
jgi:HPr kinase/phosphorylase